MRAALAVLLSLSCALPAAAQTPFGFRPDAPAEAPPQGPVGVPDTNKQAHAGAKTLTEAAGAVPSVSSVRVAWALLRVVPTTRAGRHTHNLSVAYHPTASACDQSRAALYQDGPSSVCLPVALPPY